MSSYDKAVISGRLQHVSPSQIKSYSECNRKWFLEKVVGVKQERKPHFETGERLHAQMEFWYLNGIVPENQSARLLTEHAEVPKRADHILIEYPKDYNTGLTAADIKVKGKIDLLDPLSSQGLVAIWDWKSSGNFNGPGIKDAEYLARDIQLNIYGKFVNKHFPDNPDVTLSHGYMLTKGGHAAKVVTTEPLSPGHIDTVYEAICAVVERMKDSASITDFLKVTPNYDSCDNYGGCPYQTMCGVGKGQLLDTREVVEVTKEEHKEFVAKLKAQKRTGVLPPDAPPPSRIEPSKVIVDNRLMIRIYYSQDGSDTFIQIPAKTKDEAMAAAKQFLGKDIVVKGMEIL